MAKQTSGWTLGELAEILGGELVGPPGYVIRRPVSAGTPDPEGLTFANGPEYLEAALASDVGAVLVEESVEAEGARLIRVSNPRAAFGRFLAMAVRRLPLELGVHPLAVVHPEASVDPTASVGPGAVIDAGSSIGADVRVHANAYVGENCRVGAKTVLYPQAVLLQDVHIGERCTIHSGVVIGADGFGFEWDGGHWVKIPQIGGVRIGDDVEIGANSCVDRATLGNTVIASGAKIDNLCQIGHNVQIGEHCVIAGMVGIGGSTTLGKRVVAGANAGISDHVTIGDDVVLGGRTGVASDLAEPGEYFGQPAQPKRDAIRTFLLLPKLPELWNRLRAVEKKVGGGEEE